MLWLQLAILVLVACVQGGDAQDSSAATGCQLKCSQKGGKCVDSPKDCSGQLISNMKCPAEGATCNCCIASGAGKGGKVVNKKKTASANRKGDSSQKSKKKTKKLGASNKDGKGGKVVKRKKTASANRKGDSNQKSKKKTKKLGASNKDGSSKTKSDKGKSDGKVKKNKKNKQKTKKKGSKKRKIPKKGPKKTGGKRKKDGPKEKDGPKKKSKQQKKGKGRKGGKGKGSNNKEKTGTQGDDKEECVTKCVDGTCVTNEMRCDKVNDCGNDDDTDEKGCNFAKDLKCNRCKTWDTGDVGAKFDSECGTDKNSGHIDNADPEDPYIGCATKVYKNGDVLRLFESYKINAEQGDCYEGTDAENGGPEYQYTRCWCKGDNCNTNLCEDCSVKDAAPEK